MRPEVQLDLEDGLLYFSNVVVADSVEKTFTIKNVSSFPVKFQFVKKAEGVGNKNNLKTFTYVPSEGTIKANENFPIKIIFSPDHSSNHFFDIIQIDIPNQVQEKNVYLRGYCYHRQLFAREDNPFEWKPIETFKQRYEEPLAILKNQQTT